ncbi:MAG TPA: fused MFS/spermidine synthase [Pyrinomonadaceae bacterium]
MVTPSQTTAGADEREHVSNESSAPAPNAGPGWRLRLVVFVSGAVLMGLEMTGSRVLAAHFGSSIYVWGAIIGVFLAALSAGYYSGGLLADLKPTFPLLGGLLLVAGGWLLVIPLYANWLCRAVLSLGLGERMGPLVSTLLLFGGPSVLMGMVSPFAVRLAARSVESMGNVSGKLYALSTFGSIAGTLLTAFWLIPALGARTLLQVLGLCLVALPLLSFPASRSRLMLAAAFVLITPWLFVLNSGASVPTRAGQSVVFEADSAYHHVVVVDDPAQDARFLQFNNYIESGISLSPPHGTRVSYPDSFHLARVFKPELKNILIIGGGGGVGARKFVADDPRVSVDLVEIDPLVAEVGFKYFYLEPSERLRVHVEDGRSFVRRAALKYDLVVLDAFTIGGQIPFHLTTQEFMREVKNILAPGGVFLANINGSVRGRRSRILRSEYKTLATVFESLYVFPRLTDSERKQGVREPHPEGRRNIILVALNGPGRWTRESVVSEAERLELAGAVRTPTFIEDARQFTDEPPPVADVPVLTDDYAPVDTMAF